jgi:uncharacterized protein (TIGR02266 family)
MSFGLRFRLSDVASSFRLLPMADADRRKHPRLVLSVDLDFASAHNFYAGRTRDLSLGGLFVETGIELPIGTILTMELHFLSHKHKVEAEIVWQVVEDDGVVGMGLRFVSLSDSARRSIEEFMNKRAPMGFDASPGPPPLPKSETEAK